MLEKQAEFPGSRGVSAGAAASSPLKEQMHVMDAPGQKL